MNKCVLIGRLTKKPELTKVNNDKCVCRFSLATNRVGSEEADFINCVVWNTQAENLCKYQDKGNQVAVEGKLRTENYEKDGKKVFNMYVLVSNIEFLTHNKEKSENVIVDHIKTEVDYGQQIEITDEDLPW